LVLSLAGVVPVSAAWAADSAATLSYVKGEVQVASHGATAPGKAGAALAKGDVIRTGRDSAAMIRLADGSLVKLNTETALEVGQAERGTTELNLRSGAVFSKVAKQGARDRFVIRTKTAVMGVRGTQFFTSSGADADVWMCVREGKVEVESQQDHKKVLVKEGEGVFVPVGKGVTPPKPYAWTRGLNWNMDPSAGELIDRTRISYDLLKQDYD
jgi:ferric-dicitrate binding protein FerR (iron transport regulator)